MPDDYDFLYGDFTGEPSIGDGVAFQAQRDGTVEPAPEGKGPKAGGFWAGLGKGLGEFFGPSVKVARDSVTDTVKSYADRANKELQDSVRDEVARAGRDIDIRIGTPDPKDTNQARGPSGAAVSPERAGGATAGASPFVLDTRFMIGAVAVLGALWLMSRGGRK